MAGEERIFGPVADQRCKGVQIVVKSAGRGRSEQVSVLDDTSNLRRRLIQPREIGAIAEIAGKGFDGRTWRFPVFLAFLKRRPLGKGLCPFLDAYTVSQIVAEHDVESSQQRGKKELGKRTETWTGRRLQQQRIG